MTHDELLDKIYWHWRKDPRGDGLQTISDYRRIILEVVRLHKPWIYTNYRKQEEITYCSACVDPYSYGTKSQEWPCPTIQTIEKELK